MRNLILNKLNLLLVGTLIILISSCKSEVSEPQNPLFPLSIGNSWSYENTNYNGGVPNTQTTQIKILYSYTIDGITGFSLSEYIEGEPISLLVNDENGSCVEYLFVDDKLVHNTILYNKNAQKGDSWKYKSAVYTEVDLLSKLEIEEWLITCISSDTTITTPKGDFQCIAFSYHPGGTQENGDPNHTMIDFLSENVGRVKSLHYEHENDKSWLFREMVLIDYSLK